MSLLPEMPAVDSRYGRQMLVNEALRRLLNTLKARGIKPRVAPLDPETMQKAEADIDWHNEPDIAMREFWDKYLQPAVEALAAQFHNGVVGPVQEPSLYWTKGMEQRLASMKTTDVESGLAIRMDWPKARPMYTRITTVIQK